MKSISAVLFFAGLLFVCGLSQAQEGQFSAENTYVLKADNGKKVKTYAQGHPYKVKFQKAGKNVKARGILRLKDHNQLTLEPVTRRDATVTILVDDLTSISPLLREGRKIITYAGGGVGLLLTVIGAASATGSLAGEDAASGFFGGMAVSGIGVVLLGLTGIADLSTLLIEGLSTKSTKKGYKFSIEET